MQGYNIICNINRSEDKVKGNKTKREIQKKKKLNGELQYEASENKKEASMVLSKRTQQHEVSSLHLSRSGIAFLTSKTQ